MFKENMEVKNDIIIKQRHELDLYCPKCKSIDIARNYYVKSIYGSLPGKPKDYCNSCGFASEEQFDAINFRNNRDSKLNKILDGIQ